jgi:broad specificity phosphatase PhoE
MTRVVLIHAGPTPWDVEDRIVGNHPLPLTDEAKASIEAITAGLPHDVTAIYRFKKNEACDQAAKIVGERFKSPIHDNKALDEMNLGLWQGLTRSELKFRFPTVIPQWHGNPLSVIPPDGESLEEATQRLKGGLARILRRNRGASIVMPLRPLAMRIMLGILRQQQPLEIAKDLQNSSSIETIEIADENLHQFI